MASQALDSHFRRAERRRGRLHPQARCFSQEHGDAAGRHQRLLFDIFTVDHFDAHRLILQTCVVRVAVTMTDSSASGIRESAINTGEGSERSAPRGGSQADVLPPRR